MTVIKNEPNAKTCKRCAYNHGGRCSLYIDSVTGEAAHLPEARRQCAGNEFQPRANVAEYIATASGPIATTAPNTIETPMATIHKDPWDKITKTYE